MTMKKLTTILLCVTCISANMFAQSDEWTGNGVRIGNMKIYIKKNVNEQDTMMQVTVTDPCPPCPSENETRPKPKTTQYKYHESSFFAGWGFILPDNGSDYYTVLGGKSINIDAGWMHRFQITRRFALGGTFQYSYYNYKLRDAASEPVFMEEVLGKPFTKEDINKQTYRSHSISPSVFTRLYLIPPPRRSNDCGMYIDLGVQGDYAFSKYLKFHTQSEGKDKYRDDYAFNPFTASAIARVGWNGFALFARYRFTDAFNSKALPMDLPPVTIGIQIL